MTISVRGVCQPYIQALRAALHDPPTPQGIFALSSLPLVFDRFNRPGVQVEMKGLIAALRAIPVQKVIDAINADIAAQKGSGPSNPPSPSVRVDAALDLRGPTVTVSGSGFAPGETVAITIESRRSDGQSAGDHSTTASVNTLGGFSASPIGVVCAAGVRTTHNVTARGQSSGRVGSTGVAC